MNKPLTVARQEFIDEIDRAVRESALPAFVIGEVMDAYARSASEAARTQLKNDRIVWEKEQEKIRKEQENAVHDVTVQGEI